MFGVIPTARGSLRDLIAEEVVGPPARGRYFVFDLQGLVTEAQVVRSRDLRNSMLVAGNAPYQYELRAIGRVAGGRAQADLHRVGVGPLDSTPSRGRLMAMGLALAGTVPGSVAVDAPGIALPGGRSADEVEYGIDLDRDGVVDLLTRHERLSRPASARFTIRVEHRREIWSRATGTWVQTASTAWTTESPID